MGSWAHPHNSDLVGVKGGGKSRKCTFSSPMIHTHTNSENYLLAVVFKLFILPEHVEK